MILLKICLTPPSPRGGELTYNQSTINKKSTLLDINLSINTSKNTKGLHGLN
jgi:hypothetical protein